MIYLYFGNDTDIETNGRIIKFSVNFNNTSWNEIFIWNFHRIRWC